jgi:cytochrome c oxidase subunit 3
MSHAAHAEEEIHLPEPSIWPLILAIGVSFVPVGVLMLAYGHGAAGAVLGAGSLVALVAAFGWATTVIREKPTLDINWGNRVLSSAWMLFLVSEAAIFGSFFGHLGYMLYKHDVWPPAGTPHIHLSIPAIGSGILILSSVTCHMAHMAILVNRRTLCKNWLLLTILLGFAFIALQGWEWGYLMAGYNFLPSTNVAGTLFYLITGFHGFHVITGLLLLFLVYARLEMGSFTPQRHFSFNAASWYWHFVDVIWLLVFFVLYVTLQ